LITTNGPQKKRSILFFPSLAMTAQISNPKSQAPNSKQKKGKFNSSHRNTNDQKSLEI